MRVLFLNSVRGGGGGLTSAVNLARGLASAGYEVHMACNRAGGLASRLAEVPGVVAHPLRLGPDFDPLASMALARLARHVHVDAAIADRRKDVKLLVVARALGPSFPIVHRHGAPSPLRSGATYRFFWGRIQGMVVNSRAMRRALLEDAAWLESLRIEVIHNGVDTVRFRPRHDRRDDVRRSLGLPHDSFVVAFHGVLQTRKRGSLLLRAAARLGGERVRVLFIGDGPERDALAREAASLDVAATFTGHREDVPEVLAAADVYGHLSAAEGLANSVLEALACGLPVIPTDEHSHPEQITHDCGRLVRPEVEDVAAALAELRADPTLRARMRDAARTRAEATFSLPAMIHRYEHLLQSLVVPSP